MHQKNEDQKLTHRDKHTRNYHKQVKIVDEPIRGSVPYRLFDEEKHIGKPFKMINYGAFRQHNIRAQRKQLTQRPKLTTSPNASVINDSNSEKSLNITSYTFIMSRLTPLAVEVGEKLQSDSETSSAPTRSTKHPENDTVLIDFLTQEIDNFETKKIRLVVEALEDLTGAPKLMSKSC